MEWGHDPNPLPVHPDPVSRLRIPDLTTPLFVNHHHRVPTGDSGVVENDVTFDGPTDGVGAGLERVDASAAQVNERERPGSRRCKRWVVTRFDVHGRGPASVA